MGFDVEYWVDIQKFPWPLYPKYKHNFRPGARLQIPGIVGDTEFDATTIFLKELTSPPNNVIILLTKRPPEIPVVIIEAGFIEVPDEFNNTLEIQMMTTPFSDCAVPPDMSIISPSGVKYGPEGDFLTGLSASQIITADGLIEYTGSASDPERFRITNPISGKWYVYGHSKCVNHDRNIRFLVFPEPLGIRTKDYSNVEILQNIYELLWVVVSMDIYNGEDRWSLWWNDDIVFQGIHAKTVMEKKHLRPVKKFEPRIDKLTFIWHNISGTPKVLWLDFECTCKLPRTMFGWEPPDRKPRPTKPDDPVFPDQPQPPIPPKPEPPKPPDPPPVPPDPPIPDPEVPEPFGHPFDYMIYIYWGPQSYGTGRPIIDTFWHIKTGDKQGKTVVLWNEPYNFINGFAWSYGTDKNNGVFIDVDNGQCTEEPGYWFREIASLNGKIDDGKDLYFSLNDYHDESRKSVPVWVKLMDTNYNILHEYKPVPGDKIPLVKLEQITFGTEVSETTKFPVWFLYEFTWNGTKYDWKAIH